jgi:hypothetical protein
MSGTAGALAPDRRSFSLPGDREWAPREHSEGVYFAESATERIGPFPAEAADREVARQNEYELVVALASALHREAGGTALEELAAESRFDRCEDRLLGAALFVLVASEDFDERAETSRGPVVLIDRFLVLIEPEGVVVREYDSAAQAEPNFEALREEG